MTSPKRAAANTIADVLLSLPPGIEYEVVCTEAEKKATKVFETLRAYADWPRYNASENVELTWREYLAMSAREGEWRYGGAVSESLAREYAENYPELFLAIKRRLEKEGWFWF